MSENSIMIPKPRSQIKYNDLDSPIRELPAVENVKKWTGGPIRVIVPSNLACQECEEDVDEREHYP